MSGIMSMLLGAVSSVITDAYFNLVTLLLPGNGTNGAQNNTFLDSSTNNFTITRNGNTTQGTFSPFSQTGWSNFFDGNDYLTVAGGSSLAFGSGDFSLEAFVYPTASGSAMKIYDARPNTTPGNFPVFERNASNVAVFYVDTTALITGTTVIQANTWTHVLVSRVSGNLRLFVNGVQDGSTVSNSTNFANATARPAIAVRGSSLANDFFTGYISNVRVITGSGFTSVTVPTTPLTTVSGTLLLTCQSNRFFDSGTANSGSGFAVTAVGNPSVQAFSPFVPTVAYSAGTIGGSGYFDGTGDYLNTPSTSQFEPTGNFTIAYWYYPTTLQTTVMIANYTGNNTTDWSLETNSAGDFRVFLDGATLRITGSAAIKLNQWNYIVVSRSGTTVTAYVNGSAVGSTYTLSGTFGSATKAIRVGAGSAGTNNMFGYCSGVQLIDGTALTGTIPTTPPTNVAGTSLLLNFTNAGITDATAKNDLETVGNAQISTTQSKFGGSSISFDGTGDWLLLPHTVDQFLSTGAFTIEMWVYRNASGTYGLVGKGTATTGWLVSLNSSNQVVFTHGSTTITSTGTISSATWTYIAVVREGTGTNQTKIYINGTNDGTGTVSTDFNQTNSMYVGADRTGGSAFNGYIDDLRITRGFARTVTTTPTAAFALQ